jgi:hypothetical protein
MMLPNMRGECLAHKLRNLVFRWELRSDMDVSHPVARGATIAGFWIPAKHGIGLGHVWQHSWHILGLQASNSWSITPSEFDVLIIIKTHQTMLSMK